MSAIPRLLWATAKSGHAHTGGFDYNRAMAQTLGAQLAPLTALDERGQAVALGGFWQSQPVVLAFVRHFG